MNHPQILYKNGEKSVNLPEVISGTIIAYIRSDCSESSLPAVQLWQVLVAKYSPKSQPITQFAKKTLYGKLSFFENFQFREFVQKK